ncbi:hypothetical protein [Dactylosporangium sp. CA-233914]|uniref:hypothetical protein n=1 Tax=Dactylosporangium sp. CA-233914 TaxID=3239934 RepID=UPI003D91CB18
MWSMIARRPRAGVIAALVAVAASLLLAQNPAAAATGYGGDVKRSIVIGRAQDWYDRNVPYSQNLDESTWVWDENHGRKYRPDCSGFISMTWKLTSSRNTQTLTDVSHTINWNDLLPGDALLKTTGNLATEHVRLFDKWVDASTHADFWYYEEGSTATDMNHVRVNVRDIRNDGYHPIRYDHIVKG